MKYMGGKLKLAKYLVPIINMYRKPNQVYIEPFVGGANIIDKMIGKRIGNDINTYLIAFWKAVTNGWTPPPYITREEYAHIRAHKEEYPLHLVGWAGFCCSYCGVWFGGFSGDVCTQSGAYRKYQEEVWRYVSKQIPVLKNVLFLNKSYQDLEIPKNSLVYCDPPYYGVSQYTEQFDHTAFWKWCSIQRKNNCTLLLSEYSAPTELFRKIWEKPIKSSLRVTATGKKAKETTEALFLLRP